MIKKIMLIFIVLVVPFLGLTGMLMVLKKGIEVFNGETIILNKEERFKIEGIKEIKIDTEGVNINFNTVKSNELKVNLNGQVRTTNKEAVPELITKQENAKLEIKVKRKPLSDLLYYNSDVKLDIEIPENYAQSISVVTVSGDTRLNHLNCKDFTLKAVSGNVKLEQITVFAATIETTSGDAVLKGFQGNTKIKTVSGNVYGDFKAFNYTSTIDTISGKVDIRLPHDAEFYLKAKTTSGKMVNLFQMNVLVVNKNTLEGTVGNNNHNKLELSTISGDISIIK